MRWIPFLIVLGVLAVLQMTLTTAATLSTEVTGKFWPDILAVLAVFIAFKARSATDAMIAAWTIGMLLDVLTGAGFTGSTNIGPMALVYVPAAGMIFKARDTFFTDRMWAQMLLSGAFCVFVHTGWVTLQVILNFEWSAWPSGILQGLMISLYTALVAPLIYIVLTPISGWLVQPGGRRGRRR